MEDEITDEELQSHPHWIASQSMFKMVRVLDQDSDFYLRHAVVRSDPNLQCWRRGYIRACTAGIEALTSICKQQAAFGLRVQKVENLSRLEVGTLALLEDCAYRILDNGKVKEEKPRVNTLRAFLFAIREYAKCQDSSYLVDTSCEEWAMLNETFKVRDRITHPCKLSDLDVSDMELEKAVVAMTWIDDMIGRAIEEAVGKKADATEATPALLLDASV
jgi:hypothetical protein